MRAQLARGSDDLVMLELCTTHKVISYPDFIQIAQVLNVSTKKEIFAGIIDHGNYESKLMAKSKRRISARVRIVKQKSFILISASLFKGKLQIQYLLS